MLADSMPLQSGYGDGKLSSFTYFPGARFIIVGLLARPDSYYKVSGILLRGRSWRAAVLPYTTTDAGFPDLLCLFCSRCIS